MGNRGKKLILLSGQQEYLRTDGTVYPQVVGQQENPGNFY